MRTLFLTIDKAITAYKTEREKYLLDKYGMSYKNIIDSTKMEVMKKIRMSIAVYFRNPFPAPPPLTEEEFKRIFEDLQID